MSPEEEDLTRKQRREQARAQRKQIEQEQASKETTRRRLQLMGGVVAVVVVAIVVILVATGGGGKSGLVKKGSTGEEGVVKTVTALVGGIPQSGNTLGSSTAPVTLKYFGDLECPICKEFTLGVLPSLVEKYVRSGKMRIEYHSLETATREPETFKLQQVAAYAAGEQDKAWDFIELFYHEQGEEDSGYVTESYLQGLAQQVPGLNLAKWTADRSNKALLEEVEADAQAASAAGFDGTPSFLIGKTSGTTYQTLSPNEYTEAAPYESAIQSLLKS
jgi:protein-disulfide isomerase